jgi:C4-dicarboxylate transporter, DctM subunit
MTTILVILTVILLLFLAILGLPLFAVIGGIALICLHFIAEVSIAAMIGEMYRLVNVPAIMAIPLFTFTGFMLAESNTPTRLVNLSRAVLGWLPGGLAIVALVSCAAFTALTGASGVTIIAIGGLLYAAMDQGGYPEKFSLGLLTTSGSLGLLFPPSLPLIIYGIVASSHPGTNVSIDKLFLAGVIPGTLIILLLAGYGLWVGKRGKIGLQKFEWAALRKSVREMIWELPLPLILLGGIYMGIFTASETAVVVAAYVLVIELFIYKDIKLGKLPKIMKESMVLVGGIFFILGVALGLTNFLVDQQVPMKVLDYMSAMIPSDQKIVFLLLLNVFLLVVGCLMDVFSALIVVVPLILPVALRFGVDPIHLGIIFLTNLEIGYSTPPVGLNLFISSFRFQKPVTRLYSASLPFLAIMLIALFFITYFPQLSLWLVDISRAK